MVREREVVVLLYDFIQRTLFFVRANWHNALDENVEVIAEEMMGRVIFGFEVNIWEEMADLGGILAAWMVRVLQNLQLFARNEI